MIENIYNSIMTGIASGVLGAICFFLFMCIRHQVYIKKKRWEMKLSLNRLEYTLKEIYTLLKKNLNYPNYKMMEFESEHNRIRIICKNSIQLLSLEDGAIILRGESQGKSTDELIDTECLMVAIAECFEMPVKEKGEILLKKRMLDKWALRGFCIGIAVLLLKVGVVDRMSLVKRVQDTRFTQFSSTVTIGEALEKSCVDTKWEEGTYGENKCVRFTGYTKDMGANVYVIFKVEKDTVEIVEIGLGNDSYTDNLTIHIFMTAMYNYNVSDSISNSEEAKVNHDKAFDVESKNDLYEMVDTKTKSEDVTEKYNLEDFYGSYISIDGYARVSIGYINDRMTEVILYDPDSGNADYMFTAVMVQNEDEYYLRASDSIQTIEIHKDYSGFDEYEGEGISISGCEMRTYNNYYVDESAVTVQDMGINEESKDENANVTDLNAFLGALYSIYGGDEQVTLYTDETGKLCVWNGNAGSDEPFYSQTYDAYSIEGNVLYGYAGDFVDEFVFEENGLVEVLLTGTGSTHYQTYIQEEEYFYSDWRKELGLEP